MFEIFNPVTKVVLVAAGYYNDGAAAARAAADYSAKLGCKIQPRRIQDLTKIGNPNWMYHAHMKYGCFLFQCFAYKALTFNAAPLVREEYTNPGRYGSFYTRGKYPQHCARPSEQMVGAAYYANELDGRLDRWTHTKIGRYLNEFYADVYSAEQIRDISTQWEAVHAPPVIKFATEASEIIEVFRSNRLGCASMPSWPDMSQYPALVWHSPDVAIAYFADAKGKTLARCVAYPAKKVFTHGYGDYTRLHSALQMQGYKMLERYQHADFPELFGMRLRRMIDRDKRVVGPHVDYGTYVKETDDPQFWQICPKADACVHFSNVDGYAWIRDRSRAGL